MEKDSGEKELSEFRDEYQNLEKDATTYIGLYLSALLVAVGYFAGKDARPLRELISGNCRYNIYALLAIAWGNLVFCSMLAYKSLVVHEITQFIFENSSPHSVYRSWEMWRTSSRSVARPLRIFYHLLLISVPVCVQGLLLFGLWKALNVEGPFPPIGLSAEAWFWLCILITVGAALWFLIQNAVVVPVRWKTLRRTSRTH